LLRASAFRGLRVTAPAASLLDHETESITTHDRDGLARIGAVAAPRCPDLARDAYLTVGSTGSGDSCRPSDQRLGADCSSLAADLAVPEEDLADEDEQSSDEADEVPGGGEQEQEDERNDEEHPGSLGGRVVRNAMSASSRPCSAYAMEVSTPGPVVDLLSWVDSRPRSYEETIEAWKTSCPRLSVWDDAVSDGLVRVERRSEENGAVVVLTFAGRKALANQVSPT
jgi:hypothetical protein